MKSGNKHLPLDENKITLAQALQTLNNVRVPINISEDFNRSSSK
jgi:hypothetical protein